MNFLRKPNFLQDDHTGLTRARVLGKEFFYAISQDGGKGIATSGKGPDYRR